MDEAPVFDQATIEHLKQLGGNDLLQEIFDLFMKHTPALVETILNGKSTENWDQVSRAAHSLKSSAGNIGARVLQGLASEIEAATKIGDLPAVTSLAEQLNQAFETVIDEIKKLK